MENYKRYIRHVLASNFASDLAGLHATVYIRANSFMRYTRERVEKSRKE